jgi:two-component system chemotaxis response regulator CheB
MPRSAMEHVGADRICPARDIGEAVCELIKDIAVDEGPERIGSPLPPDLADKLVSMETDLVEMVDMTSEALPGRPAGLACPSCHGGLFEVPGEPAPRYRCWVGHAWSPETLLEEQAIAFEGALWMALRSLEEKASLARRMAEAARQRGSEVAADRYEDVGEEAEEAGRLIRHLISQLDQVSGPTPATERVD